MMESVMKYKGYRASAAYSEEDECFIGKILGIQDTLIFEGGSVSELKQMFRQSVDDYLKTCEEIGKQPEKEYRGTFNVRITPQAHSAAVMQAEELGISLNQFVAEAIQEKIDRPRYELSEAKPSGVAETAESYAIDPNDLQILAKAERVLAKYIKNAGK